MRNIIREPGVTCQVCSLPTSGYEFCPNCRYHQSSSFSTADLVGSLTYAAYGNLNWNNQAYTIVRGYKAEKPGPGSIEMMENLLILGLRGHAGCSRTILGASSRSWAVVPSNKGRTALAEMVRRIAQSTADEILVNSRDDAADREFDPDRWQVPAWEAAPPDHVLIIDDSWATGSHAQSLAASFKRTGVEMVSIFTVARLLSYEWSENRAFERERLRDVIFDWTKCPWTNDGVCP